MVGESNGEVAADTARKWVTWTLFAAAGLGLLLAGYRWPLALPMRVAAYGLLALAAIRLATDSNAKAAGIALYFIGVLAFGIGLYSFDAGAKEPWLACFGPLAALVGAVRAWPVGTRPRVRGGSVATRWIAVVAAAIVLASMRPSWEFEGASLLPVQLAFMAWRLSPYALALALSSRDTLRGPAAVGAFAALLVDIRTLADVQSSESSTAALAYLFVPLWNLMLVVPGVGLLAWLVDRRFQLGRRVSTWARSVLLVMGLAGAAVAAAWILFAPEIA